MLAGNLEYVMSSLPDLSFSDSETIQQEVNSLFKKYASVDEASEDLVSILHAEAQKFLSARQFRRFQNIQLKTIHQEKFQKSKPKVVSEFSKFTRKLKQELKAYRISRKSDNSLGKTRYELIGELSENPLDAELQLLKLKWQKLNELSIGHYSDLSALIIYKLKLEVLLRWWSFNVDIGFDIYQQTLNVA